VTWAYCEECLGKQRRIDALEEEIGLLKARLRYPERTIDEGPFGSSTPSSKVPIKPGAEAERQARRGGAKIGHKGHGRRAFKVEEADRLDRVPAETFCPDCGEILESKGVRKRTVLECRPVEVEKIVWCLQRKRCPRCGKTVQGRAPGVLPKSKYGNGLLAHVAIEHYVHGVTLGRLAKQTGAGIGSLIDAIHSLARHLKGVSDRLVERYRDAPVKHADETGWRNDGDNAYGWLFCTEEISIFRFRKSRSSAVAREVLGEKKLSGVLVVDRYGAYNKAPCKIQHCYAHLLRNVQDIQSAFPDSKEVARFVETFAPLLASAMSLRGLKLSKRQFRLQANRLKKQIVAAANHPARHPAIQKIQDIFREKAERLFHWTRDPTIPADNNLAERELRPLVIARKISFGSQSDAGAGTREVLMTVLRTLKKSSPDPHALLKSSLNAFAEKPHPDVFQLLFPSPKIPP
jgi:transposase